MKREARILRDKAIDSLTLSIEFFNRPWDKGRAEAVLILLDRAFELLLKAAILSKGEEIRKDKEDQTIGFDECIRKALDLKVISKPQALTLQSINGLRDAAQHHIVFLSEQHLYIQAQSGLTLFRDVLNRELQKDLLEILPERVLPISTMPPSDIASLFDNDVNRIKEVLKPNSKRVVEATAMLRGLAIVDSALGGERSQPSDLKLKDLATKIQKGDKWDSVFPNAASIRFVTDGSGPTMSLRISKKEGVPITLVPEGTPGAMTVAVKRVDELGFYSLSLSQVAKNVGITPPKAVAVITVCKLKGDPKYHKKFTFGKAFHDRYSQDTIARLKEEISKKPIDHIWKEYRQLIAKIEAK